MNKFPINRSDSDTSESSNLSVLIVDDSPTTVKIISGMLKTSGYSVHSESSGTAALDKLKKNSYDIVLMDINMPVMSGLEAAGNFRDFEAKANTFKKQKIIAMTSDFPEAKIQEVINSGMDSFLYKPFTLNKFEGKYILRLSFLLNILTNIYKFVDLPLIKNIKSFPGNPQNSGDGRRVDNRSDSTEETKLQILVVDDSPTVLKLVSRMLSLEGHRVDTKVNGREALDTLKLQQYDAVLMDINMPEMGGLEASFEFRLHEFQKINKQDKKQKQRIIAMTGELTSSLPFEIQSAGFDGLLVKPFTVHKFHEIWNQLD